MIEYSMPPRKTKKSRRAWAWLLLLPILAVLAYGGFMTYLILEERRPSVERVVLDFDGKQRPIFYKGEMLEFEAVGEAEGLKFPFEMLQQYIDPALTYDEASDSVILTTHDKVIQLKTDQLTALVNEEPLSIRFPLERVDDVLYLPIDPLLEYYHITVRESSETGAVFVYDEGDLIQWGKVITNLEEPEQTTPLRTAASIKAPIGHDLPPNERVIIKEDLANGWYLIQLEQGFYGYVAKSRLQLDGVEVLPISEPQPAYVPWKPLGEKINLTWEQVTNRNPDTASIGDMPGLNVISPTWFHLAQDAEENFYLKNLADASYVRWAHNRGYQVWALFSNDFDPDLTSAALSSYENRLSLIKQLLSYAEMYNLQGINIDFENVYLEDKDNFTQFVRELTPFLHEQDLVVSIDVTIRGGSPMWSLFADRRELGKIVDYMIVMTYDEHWAASPVAGSVASLPWTEKGIVDIMEIDDVPASKLMLGVPFYARVWTEKLVDGKLSVSSSAKFMSGIQRIIQENNLEPVFLSDVGQHYAEYKEGELTHKIWIEDEVSMKARIDLVNKYDLAGVASWRRGFEEPEIWKVIQDTLAQRP